VSELLRGRTQEAAARRAREAAQKATSSARAEESLKHAREQTRREADLLRQQLAQVTSIPWVPQGPLVTGVCAHHAGLA
jgi:hypothetical protein